MIGKGAIRAAGRRRFSGANYIAEAVEFDGTNDWLKRSAMTVTNTKEVTYSFWIRIPTGGGKMIFSALDTASNLTTGIYLRQNSNALGDITFQCRNASNTSIITHYSTTNPVITNNAWHHVMGSYDLLNTTGSLWINGVQDGTSIQVITNDTIDFSRTFNSIGSYNSGTSPMNGDLAELYFTNEYIDLTVQSNREKFIDSTGTGAAPVDLGSDGSTPTGTQPLIYFKGAASVWNAGTNAGSGGNFTMTGAVADSSNEPVELP